METALFGLSAALIIHTIVMAFIVSRQRREADALVERMEVAVRGLLHAFIDSANRTRNEGNRFPTKAELRREAVAEYRTFVNSRRKVER